MSKDDFITYLICVIGLFLNFVATIAFIIITYYVLFKLSHFILSL
jgi:hypothetical protein